MKIIRLLAFTALLAIPTSIHAVGISLGTTASGHRFFMSDGSTPLANSGFVDVGFMTNENNASSFVLFGTAAIHGNTVFPNGLANAAFNTTDASTISARNSPIVIRVYSGPTLATSAEAGIFKSSVLYPADFEPSSVNAAVTSLSTDTWTAINPALNWSFGASSVTPGASLGFGGSTPTERFGRKFVLGPIPEPSTSMLAGLLCLLGFVRRKR